MTVTWARKAYNDLDEIAQYLAGVSDEIAESTVHHIQAAVLRLGQFPNLGTNVDDSGLRRLVIPGTAYVISIGSCTSALASEASFTQAGDASWSRLRRTLNQVCLACPLAILALTSADFPRGMVSDAHLDDARCLAKKTICPTWQA